MLKSIAIILCCQLAGEVFSRSLVLPIPGPVVGLLLLFLLLLWRGEREGHVLEAGQDGALGNVTDRILAMLGLLFVPAGVGLIDHLGLISGYAGGFAGVLLISVFVTLLVTVLVFVGVNKLTGGKDGSR